MFIERNISDRGREPVVTIRLFVISQRRHHVEEFFKGDEAAVTRDLVIVDGICQFSDFRANGSVSVTKLTAFWPAGSCSGVALTTIHEDSSR